MLLERICKDQLVSTGMNAWTFFVISAHITENWEVTVFSWMFPLLPSRLLSTFPSYSGSPTSAASSGSSATSVFSILSQKSEYPWQSAASYQCSFKTCRKQNYGIKYLKKPLYTNTWEGFNKSTCLFFSWGKTILHFYLLPTKRI